MIRTAFMRCQPHGLVLEVSKPQESLGCSMLFARQEMFREGCDGSKGLCNEGSKQTCQPLKLWAGRAMGVPDIIF